MLNIWSDADTWDDGEIWAEGLVEVALVTEQATAQPVTKGKVKAAGLAAEESIAGSVAWEERLLEW